MKAHLQALDYDELEDWFALGRGINEDGSGSASVVSDPDDETICARFSSWDKAYYAFADFVFYDHIQSEHLPKMYAFEQDGEDYVVVLEVLEHLDYDDALWQLCEHHWNSRWLDMFGKGDDPDLAVQIIREEYCDGNRLDMITPELLELQAEIYDLSFELGWCMDMHEFNIMVRQAPARDANGRFQKRKPVAVITDPWC